MNSIKYHDILVEADYSSFENWKNHLLNFSITNDIIKKTEIIPQGILWHPEFYLDKHLFLVCKGIIENNQLDLLEAGLLHDIGKETTTNIGGKRIYSYGHPEASLKFIETAKDYITNYQLTYDITKKHMDFNESNIDNIDNNKLKIFCTCDKSFSKNNAHKYFNLQECQQEYESCLLKQKQSKKSIFVMIGVSGSGKSTYIQNNFKQNLVVCPDKIRKELTGDISNQKVNKDVWKITKERLLCNLDKYDYTVLDATNVFKSLRIQFMTDFNYIKKIAVVFNTDVNICKERVKTDIKNKIDRSNVPMEVIDKQYDKFVKGYGSIFEEFNEITLIEN